MTFATQRQQSQMETFKPKVSPRLHPSVRNCLSQKNFLIDLVERYGSPLNIVFPGNLDDNIADFQSVYKKHGIRGRIYYVTKPNKSRALLTQAKSHDLGVDVSSPRSLSTVIEGGWETQRIIANGPKNRDYIRACIENGVLIQADNMEELAAIVEMAEERKVRVGVRLSGFNSTRIDFTPHDNTFGIPIRFLDNILAFLTSHKEILDFQGFSFHTASSNEDQKIIAIENTLAATFKAIKVGLSPKSINIGGGFPIMYADSCREWQDYVEVLKQSVLNKSESQTWNNSGLGYRIQNGVLAGGPMYTDHAPFRARGEALDFLLSSRLSEFDNAVFADILKDSLLELHVEPGKSLLDQCGITLGRISFTKESSLGETLVGLDMNRSNIQSSDQKMLTDPIVLYRDPEKNQPVEGGVYYMGNLCLAYDMIQYNKTYPPLLPREGDVVAFANTGAYLMDFAESESLMQPMARKIAVTQKNGIWEATPE